MKNPLDFLVFEVEFGNLRKFGMVLKLNITGFGQ